MEAVHNFTNEVISNVKKLGKNFVLKSKIILKVTQLSF